MNHPRQAGQYVADQERAHWHDNVIWFMREKRDQAVKVIPEWEELRELGSQIKGHTLSRLDDYLERFESQAKRLGVQIHWARDAEEHNQIVAGILQAAGARKVVKSKSMLTEECHLNQFLQERDIQVTDTDLGERIVQLRQEAPSHIITPAIHIKHEEVAELFHDHFGTDRSASDPDQLVAVARDALRRTFIEADAAITGVNFAVAETGGFVVCTNEGNVDMGTGLPRLHIACMGIEKVIPRIKDLGVFLRLLARSATGQPITVYTSHFHGPAAGGELHLVIVDNGRSELLQKPKFNKSLNCIRCGACMNTCPVYRRSGGHSYGYTIPGPIGSVLGPSRNMKEFASLPYASSLCGSCTAVCPVKIDLHHQLLEWRKEIARAGVLPWTKRFAMKVASLVLRNTWLYCTSGRIFRVILRRLPRALVYHRLNLWGRQRDLPRIPDTSFREWYAQRNHEQQK